MNPGILSSDLCKGQSYFDGFDGIIHLFISCYSCLSITYNVNVKHFVELNFPQEEWYLIPPTNRIYTLTVLSTKEEKQKFSGFVKSFDIWWQVCQVHVFILIWSVPKFWVFNILVLRFIGKGFLQTELVKACGYLLISSGNSIPSKLPSSVKTVFHCRMCSSKMSTNLSSNYLRQFRDSSSLELQKLSAVQFMNVWEHYDQDGKSNDKLMCYYMQSRSYLQETDLLKEKNWMHSYENLSLQ